MPAKYVKIGYTDDINKRLRNLNASSAVPFGFRAYAVYDVYHKLEDRKVHSMIDTINPELRSIDNINGRERKREFFQMTKEQAYSLFESIAEISGTKERLHLIKATEHEIKEEQKRAHFPKQAPKLFQAPGRGRDGDVKQNGNHRGSHPTDNPCKGGNQRAQVQLGKGVQVHNKIAVQFGPAKGIDKFSIHSSHPVAARWGRPAKESAGPAP